MDNQFFGTEKVWKILLKLAPPVMAAQLIQALYNIVDSYFVGRYSEYGLSALSVIYPVQLLMCAIAIGTGVGVNTVMAKYYGLKKDHEAENTAGICTVLTVVSWLIFVVFMTLIMNLFVEYSVKSELARNYACTYGYIVCIGSLGLFVESGFTKILQAKGDMKTPMVAQITGAIINILLDYIFICGLGFIPEMGITGAAIATVTGQFVAAVITGIKAFTRPPEFRVFKKYIKQIYKAGLPNMIMQAFWTVYIVGLNLVLVTFSDAAVTVLGLYYKLQMFFFIPLEALGTCMVPILSYNYAIGSILRCKKILWDSVLVSAVVMVAAVLAFELWPQQLMGLFSGSREVMEIGKVGFRIIALSFIPASLSLTFPVFFQAIGRNVESIALTVIRQVVLLVPIAWGLSYFGLSYVWLTFPITEVITDIFGLYFYKKVF